MYIDKFCNYKQPRIHVAAMTTLVVWFPVQNIRTSNHHDNRSCGSRILLITIAELWHCEVLRYMAPCTEYQPTIHPTHCRAVLMAVRLWGVRYTLTCTSTDCGIVTCCVWGYGLVQVCCGVEFAHVVRRPVVVGCWSWQWSHAHRSAEINS